MKIGDVKIGEAYAFAEYRPARGIPEARRVVARRVTDTAPDGVRDRRPGSYAGRGKGRAVLVEFGDDPGATVWGPVATAKRGARWLVPARTLEPWGEYEVAARARDERKATLASIRERDEALVVRLRDRHGIEARRALVSGGGVIVSAGDLERILDALDPTVGVSV